MKPISGIAVLAVSATLAIGGLSGCASQPKSYVVLLESPDGTTGKVVVKGDKGEQTIAKARFAAPMDGSQPPAAVDEPSSRRISVLPWRRVRLCLNTSCSILNRAARC